MVRAFWLVMGLVCLALAAPAPAAAPELAGNWKVTVYIQDQRATLWLLKLQAKDSKWTGSILSVGREMAKTTMQNVSVANDMLRFTLKLQVQDRTQELTFEGKLPKTRTDEILGSINLNAQIVPARLARTAVKTLNDTYGLAKETLARHKSGPEAVAAASTLLAMAQGRQAKPAEVRAWAEQGFKAAEPYGPRLERQMSLQIARAALNEPELKGLAAEYAQKAEQFLQPADSRYVRRLLLDTVAAILRKSGKVAEAKAVEARADNIEIVKPARFTGRKAKSDRVVLVELFTGTQCPPCVAADFAFDGLLQTYKPTEVVLLEYHEHIPAADPLTCPAGETRLKYYFEEEGAGTPTMLFDGKVAGEGGGSIEDSQKKYNEYLAAVTPLLDKPAGAKVTATAVRKGDTIQIKAEASGVEAADDAAYLRLALIEETVDYLWSGNGITRYHHVVRALPGGADGVAIKNKTAKQSATVDLAQVRKDLDKYLEAYNRSDLGPFPSAEWPLALQNLKVVAFVQNDKTKQVLQAAQIDVSATQK